MVDCILKLLCSSSIFTRRLCEQKRGRLNAFYELDQQMEMKIRLTRYDVPFDSECAGSAEAHMNPGRAQLSCLRRRRRWRAKTQLICARQRMVRVEFLVRTNVAFCPVDCIRV